MTLAEQIETVQLANERKLAAEVGAPKQEQLDTEALVTLRHFAQWAKSRGVKYLPCAPTTLAAFIRSESANGVPPERILTALEAIEQAHESTGLANCVATGVVRAELRHLKIDELYGYFSSSCSTADLTLGPRGWAKEERVVFVTLPPNAQKIIARHLWLDSRAVRVAQNRATELQKQISELKQKGNTNGTPDQTRS
jgi:hypothetical protein